MRVLIVDDLDISRMILREILTAWRFNVEEAASGMEALAKLKQADSADQAFDLVLMDWKMPGMCGVQVTKMIREDVENYRIRQMPVVVMVTAFSKDQLLREAQGVRLDAVLVKPVMPSALMDTIISLQGGMVNIPAVERPLKYEDLSASLRGSHILLVEDNEINQMVAQEFLENAGMIVTLTNNGQEGVDAIRNGQFDAVLMDMQMPVMDGVAATRLIREDSRFKNLPIIAMTGAAMEEDREACYAAGMNAHVAKPIMPEDLIGTLAKWIHFVHDEVVNVPIDLASIDAENRFEQFKQMSGFDFENILKMLNGNLMTLKKLLIQFGDKFVDVTSKLDQMVQVNNISEAAALMHNIKGAAGNLGAVDLHQVVKTLEEELIAGASLSSFEEFKRVMADTLKTISQLSEPDIAVKPVSVIDCNACDFKLTGNCFQQLQRLLEGDDYVPHELLAELKAFVPCQSLLQSMLRIEKYLENFDYGQAKNVLAEWNCIKKLDCQARGVKVAESVKPLILIVDDTPTNIHVLAESLRFYYRIKVANSGKVAFEIIARQGLPDLILLDVMMPDMDGYEACRLLKQNAETSGIPIIFVTARVDENAQARGRQLGAVDYIFKPIQPAIIRERVKKYISLRDKSTG